MVLFGTAGILVAFVLITIAAMTKDEKWQAAYGVVGLIFLFWSLGVFGYSYYIMGLIPGLTMLFALFSVYTKGNTQLISMLVTLVLLFQIAYV